MGININSLTHADDTILMAEREEEIKSLLMRMKEKSEKDGLKLNIQGSKIMTSCPISSLQIDRGKVKAVIDCLYLGSKITGDGDSTHDIKRHLILGRKAVTNLDSVLESRDIVLLTKVHIVKAMVFPVIIYRC